MRFARPGASAAPFDSVVEMSFATSNVTIQGFNEWTINGVPSSMARVAPMSHLRRKRRYRLRMRNARDSFHPMRLRCYSFEPTKIADGPTAGSPFG